MFGWFTRRKTCRSRLRCTTYPVLKIIQLHKNVCQWKTNDSCDKRHLTIGAKHVIEAARTILRGQNSDNTVAMKLAIAAFCSSGCHLDYVKFLDTILHIQCTITSQHRHIPACTCIYVMNLSKTIKTWCDSYFLLFLWQFTITLSFRPRSFKGWTMLLPRQISIQWIVWYFCLLLSHWIEIYRFICCIVLSTIWTTGPRRHYIT